MDLLKDYDCKILYHTGKGNQVADVLSMKISCTLAHIMASVWKLLEDMQRLILNVQRQRSNGYLVNLRIQPILI